MPIPSLLLAALEQRTKSYRRNERLDTLLAELQHMLEPAEQTAIASFNELRAPCLLLVGNPRSGTTIFMQCLNATGLFAVPSNLLSRFSYAPYIGAKIQRLLFDPIFSYKEELTDINQSGLSLSSELGKTKGALAPSEFFHFWRRFLPNYDPEFLDEEQCRKIDRNGLRQSIAAIEAVFERPFAAKAIILQYNLQELANAVRKVVFVHMKRHPFFVMQSILLAREAFYNDRSCWWSVKPRQYPQLQGLNPYEQIAGQVWYTNKSLKDQSRQFLKKKQWIDLDYAEFCRNPKASLDPIISCYRDFGVNLPAMNHLPPTLSSGDSVRLSGEDIERLLAAYSRFSGECLSLPDSPPVEVNTSK